MNIGHRGDRSCNHDATKPILSFFLSRNLNINFRKLYSSKEQVLLFYQEAGTVQRSLFVIQWTPPTLQQAKSECNEGIWLCRLKEKQLSARHEKLSDVGQRFVENVGGVQHMRRYDKIITCCDIRSLEMLRMVNAILLE